MDRRKFAGAIGWISAYAGWVEAEEVGMNLTPLDPDLHKWTLRVGEAANANPSGLRSLE